jgi:hypothetical protein
LSESEGPEESLCDHPLQDPPEVALINTVITSNGDTSRLPKVLPSSSLGKLKRPSFDHTHRTKFVSRGDIFDINASTERMVDSTSSVPQREPLRKPKRVASPRHQQRQIRTASRPYMLDTDALSDRVVESHSTMDRAQQNHVPQEPPRKRQKLIPKVRYQLRGAAPRVHMSSQEVANSSARTSTSGGRTTRSMNKPVLPGFDCMQPSRRRCKQVVQVLVDNAASFQPLSDQPQSSSPVASNLDLTAKSPVSLVDVARDQDRDQSGSADPADLVAPPSGEADDMLSPVVEEDQKSPLEDSALFESYSPPKRDARAQAEAVSRDAQRLQEQCDNDDSRDASEDDTSQTEDLGDEIDSSEDVHIPEQLTSALKNAHNVHEEAENLRQKFDGICILKSYESLRKTIVRWRTAQDYSHTDELIKHSNRITKEAKAILTKSAWDQRKGLEYIYKRLLPTLVRTLYTSLAYHLTEVKTMKRMSYEQLNESRSVVRAIIYLASQAKDAGTKYTRPQDVLSIVARMREMTDILDRLLRVHKLKKSQAESVQRQKILRLRQEAIAREERHDLEPKEWRQRWRVLHDQRLGAELEGRTFLSRNNHHLRQISLDNPYVTPPYWDADTHVYCLVEGLQEFAGMLYSLFAIFSHR